MEQHQQQQTPIDRLTRDLAKAAATLSKDEARFLVDYYYISQRDRIRADHQSRTLSENNEPHDVLKWLGVQSGALEGQIKRALEKYAEANPTGAWAMSVCGIGPVISAGLLAHIDITRCPTVGHIWRFAGLDSTVIWPSAEKAKDWITTKIASESALDDELIRIAASHFGRRYETLVKYATTDSSGVPIKLTSTTLSRALARRPHNASLKTLCWKVGESFVKVKGNAADVYGKFYEERKAAEHVKNEAGEFKEQAAKMLLARPTHAQRATYAAGKLPDGHLHSRAKRYAVKLFLSAYHEIAWFNENGKLPPLPYPIAILSHANQIRVPNGDLVPGYATAVEKWQRGE